MTRTLNPLRLALSAGLLLSLPACSFTGDNYGKARFLLSPEGGGETRTVTVEAKYHKPVKEDCYLELYEMRGDDRYIQWSPLDIGSACEGIFAARIEVDGEVHDMTGTVQRKFGRSTSTPFATGFYFASGGTGGMFTFFEDELPDL